jgi:hypothetical protein
MLVHHIISLSSLALSIWNILDWLRPRGTKKLAGTDAERRRASSPRSSVQKLAYPAESFP